ncbi:class I SAM-dependent methyltransferase [Mycobacterium sp. KBS0706]|uniref:class I SAM-dependent methyltransferase n=1 Tax=Mycobacterium sp. KBS0706 TaxID=2578109 RepID=UPI00163DB868|nr:methyltransferase domain-containing protein [Mycobacterium sp. KBS0706]
MATDYAGADGSTTKHRRSARRALQNWLLPMLTWLPSELLRVRLFRFMVCAVRYVWFVFILRRLRTTAGTDGVARTTVAHNLRGMLDLHVERSLRLIWPLAAQAAGDRVDLRDQQVLSIGPRTEGELFNLVAHGFRLRNITGLDLITYSPRIQLGDMHAMPYAAASFDIILAGWVISYSDHKQRAAHEILRVAKPGAIVAIGVEWGRKTPEQVAAERAGYIVGSAERLPTVDAILDLFGGRVDRVYFRQDDQDISTNEVGDLLVVFRLR